MILSFLLIILGFVALIFGADYLVNGASSLAKKNNISDLVIGLTVVAFGTSAPELVVNTVASLDGFSDIIIGNVVGSSNFNLFIILGIAALIYPIRVQNSSIKAEIPISLLVVVLLLMLANNFFINSIESSYISRIDGLILCIGLIVFIFYIFKRMKNQSPQIGVQEEKKSNLKIWAYIILGLGGLILGGKLVVDQGVNIATNLGVSQKIIGLTIIAAGTSLPELMTSVVAAFKKNSDIAIGNVIGSNIFNILLVLSISGIIRPIEYNAAFNLDIYILLGGTAFLMLAMRLGKSNKIDRWEAGLLFGFYLIYTLYLIFQEV